MYHKLRIPFIPYLFGTLACLCLPATVSAATYYVSTSGNDAGSGTAAAPFRSFAKGVSVLSPGDFLKIYPGTYNQRLLVSHSGTPGLPITVEPVTGAVVIDLQNEVDKAVDIPASYVNVHGFEAVNSSGYGVSLTGQYITISDLTVHHAYDHGIYIDGQHITVSGNTVYLSNLINESKNLASGWGSAIKVRVGGDDIRILNNTVYNNYGEGIAVTRGTHTMVAGNYVYDNFSENIYIDNSLYITVEKNISFCTGNTEFYRSGRPANAFAMGEEFYAGWGAQLSQITFRNNIAAFCNRGIVYYGADVSGGGMDTVQIVHNTFWGSLGVNNSLSIAAGPAKTRNSLIADNIFHSYGQIAWIENPDGITLKNNFWVGSPPPPSSNANGTGDRTGDVKLAAIPVAGDPYTYRLGGNSPAIDSGANVGVTGDYFGTFRPQGSGYDIGAHEYSFGSGGTTPTPTPAPPTPSPTPLADKPGDANKDGLVNEKDYDIWKSHYGQTVTGAVYGNFNGDAFVDGKDYIIWMSNYGK